MAPADRQDRVGPTAEDEAERGAYRVKCLGRIIGGKRGGISAGEPGNMRDAVPALTLQLAREIMARV